MAKVCLLSFDYGDFDKEFAVTLRIKGESQLVDSEDEEGTLAAITGKLRPAPELLQKYKNWQKKYCSIEGASRGITVAGTRVENLPEVRSECKESFEDLVENFREWLNCQDFREVENELRTQLRLDKDVRLLILTDNEQLRKMPWDTWELFDSCENGGVSISPRSYRRPVAVPPSEKLRILAILGNSKNININKDRKILENLPGAEVTFIVEPKTREFKKLWEEKWDILFFAGHSSSKRAGETGYIYINNQDKLEISELKETLKQAIKKGLKLAIFNSCDGLGLAQKLLAMNIPQVIVWREPVPDMVAEKFLRKFLEEFSQGKSLYEAMRITSTKLREHYKLERVYPGASYLPVICENPLAEPLRWPEFSSAETPPPKSVASTLSQPVQDNKYSTLISSSKPQKLWMVGGLVVGGILLFLSYNILSYQIRESIHQKEYESSLKELDKLEKKVQKGTAGSSFEKAQFEWLRWKETACEFDPSTSTDKKLSCRKEITLGRINELKEYDKGIQPKPKGKDENKAKQNLQKKLKDTQNKLPEGNKEKLKKDQENWKNYQDAVCKYEKERWKQTGYKDCIIRTIEQRLEQL